MAPSGTKGAKCVDPSFSLNFEGFQGRVLFLLTELKMEVRALKQSREVAGFDDGFVDQANTIEEFREMEERLRSPEEKQKMVQC